MFVKVPRPAVTRRHARVPLNTGCGNPPSGNLIVNPLEKGKVFSFRAQAPAAGGRENIATVSRPNYHPKDQEFSNFISKTRFQ